MKERTDQKLVCCVELLVHNNYNLFLFRLNTLTSLGKVSRATKQ